jgi:hypothetical protein
MSSASRSFIVGSLVSTIGAPFTSTRKPAEPTTCYVAQVSIVGDESKNRFHHVVVSQILKLGAAPGATAGNCEPLSSAARAEMRRAVERQLDSVVVRAPATRSTMEIRHESLDVVRSQLVNLAERARQKPGTFHRVEVVTIDEDSTIATEPLPRFTRSDTDRTACENENKRLIAAGAQFRWGC